jgi:methylthioribulose-1-phosphate dehydratase
MSHPPIVAADEWATAVAELVAAGRRSDARGWVAATSGNFSRRIGRDALAITRSGPHKGALVAEDFLLLGLDGEVRHPLHDRVPPRPSAETLLHLQLYRAWEHVGAVIHVHSPGATVLSRRCMSAARGGQPVTVRLAGYEMLKALAGVNTHEHEEHVPVVANSQDMQALAAQVEREVIARPGVHAYLIAGHGIYTWGRDVEEAMRQVEALEFLFECELRATPAMEGAR